MRFQNQAGVYSSVLPNGDTVLIGAVCRNLVTVGYQVQVCRMVKDGTRERNTHLTTPIQGTTFATVAEAKKACRSTFREDGTPADEEDDGGIGIVILGHSCY